MTQVQGPTGTAAIRTFPQLNVPESNSSTCAGASRRRGGRHGNSSRTSRKACSWRRLRRWRATGRRITIGAKCEAKLNAIPQFFTEIDGQDIHFIHVRSKHENALPLIVTHGWPGSIIEQMKIIDPLTNPTAHGASASDAFHLVIPSIPGYGYSPEPTTLGWDPVRIAKAWVVLMQRLGYHAIRRARRRLGRVHHATAGFAGARRTCSAFTATCPAPFRPTFWRRQCQARRPARPALRATSCTRIEQLSDFYTHHLGLRRRDGESPANALRIDGFTRWPCGLDSRSRQGQLRDDRAGLCGHPGGLSRDDVLDNITMYWLTKTAISSARLYWENKLGFFNVEGRHDPGRRQRVSARDLYGAAELVGEGLSQTGLLQEARRRRPLCGLGTAAALLRRRSRDVPVGAK